MKKYTTLVIALLVLWGCKKEEPANYVILSGNISNTKGGELKITSLNGFSKTINVMDTGTFNDTLYIPEDGLYNLHYEQGRMAPYLVKGATIHFDADAKKFYETLKFSGDNTELNNYYAYKANKDYNFMMNRAASYNVEESTFEAKIKDLQIDLENKLKAVKDIPEDIQAKELRAINYGRLAKKKGYERMYGYLSKNREFKASSNFNKEITDLSLDNGEDYMYSSDYQSIVESGIRSRAYEFYQKDSLPYPEAQAKALSEIKNEIIKNAELYKNISMGLSMSKDKDKDLQEFLKASTNQSHIASVKEIFESLKLLDSGQPSPKFVDYENYAGGKTSLDDLKGKYVYIDVWATWCGPCKYEIPFLKTVEEKYHGKNIQFVSISTDKQKDKDKWKKMIEDEELGGIQLITDNDFNTKFISDYKIMGIPQFILLDPEGKIVKANAPRPSDEKLIELFNDLGV
ncbi:TlpA family protein disulfide reductase [Cellulophaga baltica]|uniref:TlpA family protein disulfide reductase n=1 Tax=Cellulophaga baltica TaxID=76594 RepID=UPI0015F49B76|nr:TlpA disulfide reductase family protein [Cellulophaga baltica]MBA6316312.1 TlpA family protein disulfide reductase [Cellulophaga baltica]